MVVMPEELHPLAEVVEVVVVVLVAVATEETADLVLSELLIVPPPPQTSPLQQRLFVMDKVQHLQQVVVEHTLGVIMVAVMQQLLFHQPLTLLIL
jgi:hypothetical protein